MPSFQLLARVGATMRRGKCLLRPNFGIYFEQMLGIRYAAVTEYSEGVFDMYGIGHLALNTELTLETRSESIPTSIKMYQAPQLLNGYKCSIHKYYQTPKQGGYHNRSSSQLSSSRLSRSLHRFRHHLSFNQSPPASPLRVPCCTCEPGCTSASASECVSSCGSG